MVFAHNGSTRVPVPNVNIGNCDYTIAFWIKLLHLSAFSRIFGSSRSGKVVVVEIGKLALSCHEVAEATQIHMTCVFGSSGAVKNIWTHIAVTCEQDNRVKIFSNGEIANITQAANMSFQELVSILKTLPPEETFVIEISHSEVIMDLHILGFALPPDEIYDLYRGQ